MLLKIVTGILAPQLRAWMGSGSLFPQLLRSGSCFSVTFPQRLLRGHRSLFSLCSVSSCESGARQAHPALLSHSGWIAALSELHGNLAVAVIMMVVAGFFTLCAVLSLFLLKQVGGSEAGLSGCSWGVLARRPPPLICLKV